MLLFENPFFTGASVGEGRYINLVTLGYLVPAILAGILAVVYQKTRDEKFRGAAAITSIVLAMAYLTLEVRTLYQGPVLDRFSISDEEQYTYSAVWLVFAVVLLLVGILRRSQPVRLASAAVLLATIAKVFFIDLAGLTGVWRALSFIGLGVVLVGIGLLYQRPCFRRRRRLRKRSRKPNLKPYRSLIACGEAALSRGLSPFGVPRSLTTIGSHVIPNHPAPV